MRRGALLFALIAALGIGVSPLGATGGSERDFTIYYTSSLNGNLDGCTCVSNPKAGLVKRAAYLRSRQRSSSVLVDAGDILDVSSDPALAGEIVEVYRELGYDAVGMGDQELSNGIGALLSYAGKLPILSNNLSVKVSGTLRPLSPLPVTVHRGNLEVTILSLIDPEVFTLYPASLKAELELRPPADVLGAYLAERAKASERELSRLTLLLYHGSVEAAARLVGEKGGVDVVVVGHEQRLIHPEQVGGSIMVSPGEEGNRLGMLTLRLTGGKVAGYSHEFRLFDYARDIDDSSVRKRITQYRDALRAKAAGR